MTVAELREQREALAATALSAADAAEAAEGTDGAQEAHEAFLDAERTIKAHDERIARAEAIQRARAEYKPLPEEPKVAAEERTPDRPFDASVKREAPVYHQGQEGQGFFSDLYKAKNGDMEARARLERSNAITADDLRENAKTAKTMRERMHAENVHPNGVWRAAQ